MKKYSFGTRLIAGLFIVLILLASILLTGCSKNPNQDVEKGKTYAMIRLPDGSLVGGPVTDYARAINWITVDIDGVRYKTDASNVVITRELE